MKTKAEFTDCVDVIIEEIENIQEKMLAKRKTSGGFNKVIREKLKTKKERDLMKSTIEDMLEVQYDSQDQMWRYVKDGCKENRGNFNIFDVQDAILNVYAGTEKKRYAKMVLDYIKADWLPFVKKSASRPALTRLR